MRNKVQLIGNLGMDPEVKDLKSGKLARFSVATHDTYKKQDGDIVKETHWHNVVAWGKLADAVGEKLSKGMGVALEGSLISRSYEDKDGVKKYVTEVRMDDFVLTKSAKEAEVGAV